MAASRWATALRATIAAVIVEATEAEIAAATVAPAVVAAVAAVAPAVVEAAAAVTATEMKRTREAKASRVFLGKPHGEGRLWVVWRCRAPQTARRDCTVK